MLHITGPCCAGKTHVIRSLTASSTLNVWDAGVERKRSGTTTAAIPKLKRQLKPGTTMVVESSGQHRQLNAMLYAHADVRTIHLAEPSHEQVVDRAKSRGVTTDSVDEFNAKFNWPDGVSQSTASYLASKWVTG